VTEKGPKGKKGGALRGRRRIECKAAAGGGERPKLRPSGIERKARIGLTSGKARKAYPRG